MSQQSLLPDPRVKLVGSAELARQLKISPSAITRAVSDGRLHPNGRTKSGRPLFDVPAAKASWLAHSKRRMDGPALDGDGDGDGEDDETQTGHRRDYYRARARREQANAQIAELALARERRELVSRLDIQNAMAGAASLILNLCDRLPASLAPRLVGINDQLMIEARLRDAIDELLQEFSVQLEKVASA